MRSGNAAMGAVALVVAFLALYPIGWLVYGAFRSGAPFEPGVFTLANFTRAYADPEVLRAIGNTLVFAVGQTIGALVIGAPLAWIVTRTNVPGARAFEFLTLVLFLFPLIMAVFAWTMLLSPQKGLVNTVAIGLLGLESAPFDVYTMAGMVFVQSLYVAPLAFLILAPVFASMDATLEEAARIAGAPLPTRLFRIVLPLASPAIASAAVLLFIVGLESFDVPQLLGAQRGIYTYPSLIYHAVSVRVPADYGLATALATSLLGTTVLAVVVYRRLVRRAERFATLQGKGLRTARVDLGRARIWVAAGCWLFFAFTVIAPFAVLLIGSFLQFFGRFSWAMFGRMSLANYPRLFAHPQLADGLVNSLALAIVGGALCVLLAAVVGFIAIRTRYRGRGALEAIAMLPLSFPATVLGLALVWAWIKVPLAVYGTVLILAIAYITRYLPIALRTVSGALVQLGPEHEEAARMAGAAWGYRFRRVVLPLIRPALAAAWLLMFMIFVRELGMSVLLVGTGNPVLSVVLFDYYQSGELGLLAAASVLLVALIVAILALAQRYAGLRFTQFSA